MAPLVKKWMLDEHIEKIPIDHADRSVTKDKLEYPTVDVSLAYLHMIGKAYVERVTATKPWYYLDYLTTDSFADKAVEGWLRDESGLHGRWVDVNNMYYCLIRTGVTTSDFRVSKRIAGTWTLLGYEAVDLNDLYNICKFSISGTSLKGYREDLVTPKISVTDTALTSGKFGSGDRVTDPNPYCISAILRAPSSPVAKPLSYFLTPIEGEGTEENPYHALLPEKIETHPDYGEVNIYALSHSSLIPTQAGIPKYNYCLVRIFDQPERQPHLAKIHKCIRMLKRMEGVKRLTREEAIKLALKMDPKLKIKDLDNWL